MAKAYCHVIRSIDFILMLLYFVVCSDHVVKKANIATTSTGNDIATFREVSALSPRGRYDIKFYPTFVHLHGKTFDYKVKMKYYANQVRRNVSANVVK
jgi:hypothetical protein